MINKRIELKIILFSLLTSFVFITLCSKNSFLYPMQDWVDANCFFTVGKSMINGKVLYRDIFEQKGPFLYFIYCLVCAISTKSFIGAYIIELCCFTAFLYTASKIVRLYNENVVHISWILPALAFAVTTAIAFVHGGSVEELSLFCFTYVMYVTLKLIKNPEQRVSRKEFFFCGIMIGLTFWTKYSMVGLYVGSYLTLFIFLLKEKRIKEIFHVALYTLVGLIIASAPVFIYFISNDAISDLINTYFMYNINVYGAKVTLLMRIKNIILGTGKTLLVNISFSVFAVIGVLWMLRKKNFEALFVLLCGVFYVCIVYIGDVRLRYYGLPLCVFSIFGFCCISFLVNKFINTSKSKFISIVIPVFFVILSIVSVLISSNSYLLKYSRDDMPQYKFAKIIKSKEDSTMFYYGSFDAGFYFAADKIPQNKYFCSFNRMTEEVKTDIESVINNAENDYIVSRGIKLEKKFDNLKYTCIASEDFLFEHTIFTYYLYEKSVK